MYLSAPENKGMITHTKYGCDGKYNWGNGNGDGMIEPYHVNPWTIDCGDKEPIHS